MAVLGMVEFNRIVMGLRGADAMVKAASVELLQSHPIDPGKYLAVVTGDLASVEASVTAGITAAVAENVVESFVLPNLHEQILPVLRGQATKPACAALGAVETNSAAAIVMASDAACKASPVQLLTLSLALHIGGKGYTIFVGDVADVEASVQAAVETSAGHLIDSVVIPNPYPEFYGHLGTDETSPPLPQAKKP